MGVALHAELLCVSGFSLRSCLTYFLSFERTIEFYQLARVLTDGLDRFDPGAQAPEKSPCLR